jgi:hypothetical protein
MNFDDELYLVQQMLFLYQDERTMLRELRITFVFELKDNIMI